ncbi:MAG TPA: hypothetical protein PLS20_06080 [Ruminococcus flavefaciens]|nr:hypothetical protein [Ruminococcus flavefaciens]
MNTNFTELSMTEIQTIDGGWNWKEWWGGVGDVLTGAASAACGAFYLDPDTAASGIMSITDGMGRIYYGASH